jgi:hypothetical protein
MFSTNPTPFAAPITSLTHQFGQQASYPLFCLVSPFLFYELMIATAIFTLQRLSHIPEQGTKDVRVCFQIHLHCPSTCRSIGHMHQAVLSSWAYYFFMWSLEEYLIQQSISLGALSPSPSRIDHPSVVFGFT